METQKNISCPECGNEINVNELLYHQLEDQIKKECNKKIQKREKEIEAMRAQVDNDREKITELVAEQVQNSLKSEKQKLETNIRKKLLDEVSEQMKDLQKELEEKSAQLRELNRTKAEIERLKREKDELKEQLTLEKEAEITERLRQEKAKTRILVEEETSLRIQELEKQLRDQKKLAEEMKRKAEQGSIQLQGEIQELAIESLLKELYIYDDVREIKKGQRGADTLQTVKTIHGAACGKIYYESKRTRKFEEGWLQKLRDDNLTIKADVLVIVTETMPDGVDKFFFQDGVWVCPFRDIKPLSLVLRHGLLQIHSVTQTQQDKGSKMELLYCYLTSREFSGQFGAIIEGFKALQDNYSDEKLKMQKVWKQREKQLEKILVNAVECYASLRGIGGASVPQIKMLEAGMTEEESKS